MINASSLFLPRSIKDAFLKVSTALSVAGIALGVFSQIPSLTTCAVMLGVTNAVAWFDLDSSEKVKAYEKFIKKWSDSGNDQKKSLFDLIHSECKAQKDVEILKDELQTLTQKNLDLGGYLKSTDRGIENLRKTDLLLQKKITDTEELLQKKGQEISSVSIAEKELEQEIIKLQNMVEIQRSSLESLKKIILKV